jgi:hypothetical protein
MALPGSGQLSLSAIRDEFGAGTTSNVSLRTLSAAAGLTQPDGFNEFYGLANYTVPSYTSGASVISGAGTAASPYSVTLYNNFFSDFYSIAEEDNCPDFYIRWFWHSINNSNNQLRFTPQSLGHQRMNMQVTGMSSNFRGDCAFSGFYMYSYLENGSGGAASNNASGYGVNAGTAIVGKTMQADMNVTNLSTQKYVFNFSGQQPEKSEFDGGIGYCEGSFATEIYPCTQIDIYSFTFNVWFTKL